MTDTSTNPAAVARNPHRPYIVAVCSAMPDEHIAADWFVSDAETAADGNTCTLSAVISWDDEASPDVYPDGMILCWDLEEGWQHAAIRADRSNESPEYLLLPMWAAPEDVAAAATALLRGEELPVAKLPEWRDDAVMAAVKAWEESE